MEDVSYHINQDGLNQLTNYTVQKDMDTYRIIAIGDSHTFGQNVNTHENYPSQLENLLNQTLICPTIKKFEVLNLGVWGYDFQYTVERFKRRGQKYHPNLVIWLVIPDNFSRILEMSRPQFRNLIDHLKKDKNVVVLTPEEYTSLWLHAKDETVKKLGGEENILHLQKLYLQSLNSYYSGPLLFAFDSSMPKAYKKTLIDLQEVRERIYIYDNLPNLDDRGILPDKHPNTYGYSLIAQNLVTYLTQNKLLPCTLK